MRKTEGVKSFLPKRRSRGDLTVFQYLEGSYKKDRGSLHKEPYGEGTMGTNITGRSSSSRKKDIFYSLQE